MLTTWGLKTTKLGFMLATMLVDNPYMHASYALLLKAIQMFFSGGMLNLAVLSSELVMLSKNGNIKGGPNTFQYDDTFLVYILG